MRYRPTTTPHSRLRFMLMLDAARRGQCFVCLKVPHGERRRAKRIMRITRAAGRRETGARPG